MGVYKGLKTYLKIRVNKMSTEIQNWKFSYPKLIEKIDKYLYEYNITPLVHEIAYILGKYGIYFRVDPLDVILAYKDTVFQGAIVTIVLKTGVAIKVKISSDEKKEYVRDVEIWYVSE
jgi:hypothetical protein